MVEGAKGFSKLGFKIFATAGTAAFLGGYGLEYVKLFKVNEGEPNVVEYIKKGLIQLVVNTPLGETSRFDELAIGNAALEAKLLMITTISAAAAAVKGIQWMRERKPDVRSLQEYHSELVEP